MSINLSNGKLLPCDTAMVHGIVKPDGQFYVHPGNVLAGDDPVDRRISYRGKKYCTLTTVELENMLRSCGVEPPVGLSKHALRPMLRVRLEEIGQVIIQ